jgi:hypothetical protein
MRLRTWLLMGALAGLVAGLLVDRVIDLAPLYMRLTQVAMILFGAVVAAFVYEGARAVTEGREPSHSTDQPRRGIRRIFGRRPPGHSGPVA